MKTNNNFLRLIKIYLLVLAIFSIFRILLFSTELDRLDFNEIQFSTIIKSFIMGVRFDIVISSYILFIPALILFILEIFQNKNRLILKFIFYWIFIFFSIAFIVSSADIPYFNQFYDRFSIGAFEWIENVDFVVSMIIQEPKYYLIFIPFFILEIFFFIFLKKIFVEKPNSKQINIYAKIVLSLTFLLLIFVGIRGRVQKKSPIRIGTAYFSDNSFLNKLGLNPSFTLIRSYLDSKNSKNSIINLMDNEKAIEKVQGYLNIEDTNYNSPIAREITFDTSLQQKPNVILIIMESMSAAKMTRYGNKDNITPFLDSLANNSTYFENIYTAGKHTFNGIFSTLFSFPGLYRQHPMKKINQYDGISSTLLKNNYSTTYFTTHDSQFDNIEGFLRANDFQNIISQSDYPNSEIKTTLGVPDDYMFRYSIPVLNKLHKRENPFFVTFMTSSDHGPYYVPEYFTPKTNDIKKQITEYADWSLNEFLKMSSKEEWFDNTIFVFVADHGAPLNAKYDISLNYFHTPLLFYAPKIFQEDKTYKNIGSQIDIYPTIMGMLKIPYINNTLGVDLINEKRKYAIINDDDKIGILDTTYFCILKQDDAKLYKYREDDKFDYSAQNKEMVEKMTEYGKANMQVFQMMLLNKQTKLNSRETVSKNK